MPTTGKNRITWLITASITAFITATVLDWIFGTPDNNMWQRCAYILIIANTVHVVTTGVTKGLNR